MNIKYIILFFAYVFMGNAEIRRLLVVLGAIIIILSGFIALFNLFISGIMGIFTIETPARFVMHENSFMLALFGILYIIFGYIIYEETKNKRKKSEAGFVILILSIFTFFIGGGFVIGPLLSGIGGILLIL